MCRRGIDPGRTMPEAGMAAGPGAVWRARARGVGAAGPGPRVLLPPWVPGGFAPCAPGLPGPARRTLRTSLRFRAGGVVPAVARGDAPLPREHAKPPYSPAEIDGYLAQADAQPAAARR